MDKPKTRASSVEEKRRRKEQMKKEDMQEVNLLKKNVNLGTAEYAAALIAGKFKLPSREVMLKAWLQHVHALHAKGKKIVDVNTVFDDMDEYFGKFAAEAGTARVPRVLTDMRDFNAVARLQDLLNYRDYDYEVIDDHHFRTWYNPREETCDFNE